MASYNSKFGATGSSYSKSAIPGYNLAQISNKTPEQMNLFKMLLSGIGPNLGTGLQGLGQIASGNPKAFEAMEAPAQREFQGALGDISSRFSGLGSGARHSSGFDQAAAEAGSGFADELSSRRLQLQRQALMDLLGLSHGLMNEDVFDTFLDKKKSKNRFGWLGGALPAVGGALGGLFGGPGGSFLGANIGSAAGRAFL